MIRINLAVKGMRQAMRARLRDARKRAQRFAGADDGGMVFFALVILTIMLFVGGMAIDLMRYEAERSRIQAVADSSALAAASMRQDLPPVQVVEDWFAKADLSDALTGVVVDTGMNYKTVRAETRTVTRPYFMHMLGIDELRSAAAGRATERRTNVEISLVLDISGSMAGSKMTNLKSAAVEFVDRILREDTENKVSISLVPYNGQVNIGPDLINRYNLTDRHTSTYCVDLPTEAWNNLALSRTTPWPQNANADTYNSSNTSTGWSNDRMSPSSANRWCFPNAANRILAFNNSRTGLIARINNLEAIGATSIDLGLRWGAALIDPDSRSLVSEMVSAGIVPSSFEGRPFDYDDEENIKVIVLMTDGSHWPNEKVADGFRSGTSPIYLHSDGMYSIHHPGRDGTYKYWVPHRSEWRNVPWSGSSTCQTWSCVSTSTRTPLTWQTVWQQLRVQWVANQMYRRALGGTVTQWVNHLRVREGTVIGAGPHEVSTMDTRLNNLCTKLKDENVMIFGIAFEAPPTGAQVIQNCASSNRFYDVNGLDISTAFRSIRAQISALRLTQ